VSCRRPTFGRRLSGVALLCVLSVLAFAVPSALAAPGDLDPSFSGDGKLTTDFGGDDSALDAVVQPDRKTVVVGTTRNIVTGVRDFVVVRYNTDGSLDTTFGDGGSVRVKIGGDNFVPAEVLLQPGGKIVVVASSGSVERPAQELARLNPDGTSDATFGVAGKVNTDGINARGAALTPDGGIVVAGNGVTGDRRNQLGVVRYTADGVLDPTFGEGGKRTTDFGTSAGANAVAVQPDGKIVAAGLIFQPSGNLDFVLVRYTAAGSLDSTFGDGGKVTEDFGGPDVAEGLVLQPDGKAVVAGTTRASGVNGTRAFVVARYTPGGSLDQSFDGDGKQTISGSPGRLGFDPARLALQQNGQLVVAGAGSDQANASVIVLARLNPDGGFDPSFGTAGRMAVDFAPQGNEHVYGMAIGADAKIVVVGDTAAKSDQYALHDFAVARFDGSPPPPAAGGGGGGNSPPPPTGGNPRPPAGNPPLPTGGNPPPPAGGIACPAGNSRGVKCTGRTKSGGLVIVGTNGDDKIVGTGKGDRITGGGGRDTISGGGGNDSISGGSGSDRISGGSGNDRISGGSGNDRLSGDSGNDSINGGPGNDRISGGPGNDRLSGSQGNDTIFGGSGNDSVAGGPGNDRLSGGSGKDSLRGDSGNDRINGDSGVDRVSGGSGADVISARDRRRDSVDCGSGRDRVSADRIDRVARNCDRVTRR